MTMSQFSTPWSSFWSSLGIELTFMDRLQPSSRITKDSLLAWFWISICRRWRAWNSLRICRSRGRQSQPYLLPGRRHLQLSHAPLSLESRKYSRSRLRRKICCGSLKYIPYVLANIESFNNVKSNFLTLYQAWLIIRHCVSIWNSSIF